MACAADGPSATGREVSGEGLRKSSTTALLSDTAAAERCSGASKPTAGSDRVTPARVTFTEVSMQPSVHSCPTGAPEEEDVEAAREVPRQGTRTAFEMDAENQETQETQETHEGRAQERRERAARKAREEPEDVGRGGHGETCKDVATSACWYLTPGEWAVRFTKSGIDALGTKGLFLHRTFNFMFFLGVTIYSWTWETREVFHRNRTFWLTQMTHWTALLECLYFGVLVFISVQHLFMGGTPKRPTWYKRLAWILASFLPTLCLTVVLLYWFYIASPRLKHLNGNNVLIHGVSLILITSETALNRVPIRFSHIYCPMLGGAIYVIFTLVYFVFGGVHFDGVSPYIYKRFDWSNTQETGGKAAIAIFGIIPVLHFLVCLCVLMRDHLIQASMYRKPKRKHFYGTR